MFCAAEEPPESDNSPRDTDVRRLFNLTIVSAGVFVSRGYWRSIENKNRSNYWGGKK